MKKIGKYIYIESLANINMYNMFIGGYYMVTYYLIRTFSF